MPPQNFRYPIPAAPDTRKTVGWWGIGSVTSGLLALAFLPAAMLGGGEWAFQLWNVSYMWAVCCMIGVATGIRGMQKQRRATKRQRRTAFVGTILSLLIFMAFTVIVIVMTA